MANTELNTNQSHESRESKLPLEREVEQLLAEFDQEFDQRIQQDPLSIYSLSYFRDQVPYIGKSGFHTDRFGHDTQTLILLAKRKHRDDLIWQKCSGLLEEVKRDDASPADKKHAFFLILSLLSHVSEMGRNKDALALEKKLNEATDPEQVEQLYQQLEGRTESSSKKGVFKKLARKAKAVFRGTAITAVNTAIIAGGTAQALHIRDIEDVKDAFKTAFKPMVFGVAELIFPNDAISQSLLVEAVDRYFDQGRAVDFGEVISILTEGDARKRQERAVDLVRDWESQVYLEAESLRLEDLYTQQIADSESWERDVPQQLLGQYRLAEQFLEPLLEGYQGELEEMAGARSELDPVFVENSRMLLFSLAQSVVQDEINRQQVEGDNLAAQYQAFFDQLSDTERSQLASDIKSDWLLFIFGGNADQLHYLLPEFLEYYQRLSQAKDNPSDNLAEIINVVNQLIVSDALVNPSGDFAKILNFVLEDENRLDFFDIETLKTVTLFIRFNLDQSVLSVDEIFGVIDQVRSWNKTDTSFLLQFLNSIKTAATLNSGIDLSTMMLWMGEFDDPSIGARLLLKLHNIVGSETLEDNWNFLFPYLLEFEHHDNNNTRLVIEYLLNKRAILGDDEFESTMRPIINELKEKPKDAVNSFAAMYIRFYQIVRDPAELAEMEQFLLDFVAGDELFASVSYHTWEEILIFNDEQGFSTEIFRSRVNDIRNILVILDQKDLITPFLFDEPLKLVEALFSDGMTISEIMELLNEHEEAVLKGVIAFMPTWIPRGESVHMFRTTVELLQENPRLLAHPHLINIISELSDKVIGFQSFNPEETLIGIDAKLDLLDLFLERNPDADVEIVIEILFSEFTSVVSSPEELIELFPQEFEPIEQNGVLLSSIALADTSKVRVVDNTTHTNLEDSNTTIRVPLLFLGESDKSYVFNASENTEPIDLTTIDDDYFYGEYTRNLTRHLLTIDNQGFARIVTYGELGETKDQIIQSIHQHAFVAVINPIYINGGFIYEFDELSEIEIRRSQSFMDVMWLPYTRFSVVITDQGNIYTYFLESYQSDEEVIDAVSEKLVETGESISAILGADLFKNIVRSSQFAASTKGIDAYYAIEFGLENVNQTEELTLN